MDEVELDLLADQAAQRRNLLSGQGEDRRAVVLQRQLPCLGRFGEVGRAEHEQAGDGPQRGEVLHRLVGRAIFAQAD